MSREKLETESCNIFVYKCDYCSTDKNFFRLCEYCKKDVCVDCSTYQAKDLFWHNQTGDVTVCNECLDRFKERYQKTTIHMNNAITEFELEFRNERNVKS